MVDLVELDGKIYKRDGTYLNTDCFAFNMYGKTFKCAALHRKHCQNCSFYKTREQVQEERKNAPEAETFTDSKGIIRVRAKKV